MWQQIFRKTKLGVFESKVLNMLLLSFRPEQFVFEKI